jgi:hypothetical protein
MKGSYQMSEIENTTHVDIPDSDAWGVVDVETKKNEDKAKTRGISRMNLRNGEGADVVMLTGAPMWFNEHFNEYSRQSSICTMESEGHCVECERGGNASKKGFFMVLDRKHMPKEKKNGEWMRKLDEKGKPIVTPALKVLGQSVKGLFQLKEVMARVEGGKLLGQEITIKRNGDGPQTVYMFFANGPTKSGKLALNAKEKEILAGRSEVELKELVRLFLLNPRKANAVVEGAAPTGEPVEWNDESENLG